jgi:hypothetical protein
MAQGVDVFSSGNEQDARMGFESIMRHAPIRIGDVIKVIDPRVVERVGYPRTVDSYVEEAESTAGKFLDFTLRCPARARCKLIREIAYALALKDGFGGRERTLHFIEIPQLLGESYCVQGVRSAKTGTYSPGYRSSMWGGNDDEPPSLSEEKTRRLVQISTGMFIGDSKLVELPVEHVVIDILSMVNKCKSQTP